ncbi:MAG: hypothetical protein ACOYM9_21610 [Bradymonadia bacterium]
MALDLRIRTGKTLLAEPELRVSFNDDGYYWCLHPLFERLRDECGKSIDLYGDAHFTRDDYPRLRRLLDEASALAKAKPATWDVHVGTQVKPTKKALYATVRRVQLLKLIETMRNMVETADRLDGHIECIGG